jgi:hypothetical protein
LADLLPKPEEEETPPPWRPGRLELAGIVGGLLLAAALVAGLNVLWPAPAPRLTRPTAAPAPTARPTVTTAPTAAPTTTPEPPTETPAPPPTPEPVIIIQEPPCDPTINPRYVVELDLSPLGRARGVSCNSQEEAAANAEAQAALVRAAFEPTPTEGR